MPLNVLGKNPREDPQLTTVFLRAKDCCTNLVVFDPDTVQPVTEDVVHDSPNNGWRMRKLAEGIHYTVVNGEVLLEKGTHTGSYPAVCGTTPGITALTTVGVSRRPRHASS